MSAVYRPLLLLIAFASYAATAKNIEQSFPVSSGQLLTLKTDQGRIEVRTHSLEQIDVNVFVEGEQEDEFDVSFTPTGQGLQINGEKTSESHHRRLKVSYEITVPENFNLDLDTSGGSISIDDLKGNAEARTSGGSIAVGDINGDVELHTSGGSIQTENIYGGIDAHTSGGSIRVTFAHQPTQNASLSTSGGSIIAKLPMDATFDLNASTSGGKVRSEFEVQGQIRKQSIRGSVNGGGPELALHTSGGSVRVEKI
ncbi:hypothetical protein DXV75_11970 [Alteromonas aestuariivivens]|uniref:DUF4097 domain-containing protein n=1 Tax=Alteromonas aestuariivivens TaxID=1938339 RepID=A0A3D8M585_9ALTE|nr:DUF4097 family beta strand repeat-containing protein [Alteromonas aestuariivivens]RDV24791.1 hypothetical protein DXV75_11970 [Alteromonas aestuariivivens]